MASSNTSRIEAHTGFFRLLIKIYEVLSEFITFLSIDLVLLCPHQNFSNSGGSVLKVRIFQNEFIKSYFGRKDEFINSF